MVNLVPNEPLHCTVVLLLNALILQSELWALLALDDSFVHYLHKGILRRPLGHDLIRLGSAHVLTDQYLNLLQVLRSPLRASLLGFGPIV